MRLIHVVHQLPIQATVTFKYEDATSPWAITSDAATTPGSSPQQQRSTQTTLQLPSPRSRLSSFSSSSCVVGRARTPSTSSFCVSSTGLAEQLHALATGVQDLPSASQQRQTYTPPATSPSSTALSPIASSPDISVDFTFAPRSGHAVLFAGLAALEQHHEAVYVGALGKLAVNVDSPTSTGPSRLTSSTFLAQQQQQLPQSVCVGGVWLTAAQKDQLVSLLWKKFRCILVLMDDKTERGHYEDYCKGVLWPSFHYNPSASVSNWHHTSWEAYAAANEAYADATMACYKQLRQVADSTSQNGNDDTPHTVNGNCNINMNNSNNKIIKNANSDPVIWIHDYHFLLLPDLIRKQLPQATIGSFIHTPFPSSEVFRCLPQRKQLLNGMLGANIIGFQTYSYGRHFISSCTRVLGLESTPTGVYKDAMCGSMVQVGIFPIGIDVDKVQEMCKSPLVHNKVQNLHEIYSDKKIIVGSDELDQTKGVVQKLQAFDKFLQMFPEWVGNVVLVQLTQPAAMSSPVHAKLETKVSELVSAINGRYGSISFTPVHHIHRDIDLIEYFALLSVADACLITSTRDGMNTTSHDYVIAQHLPQLQQQTSNTSLNDLTNDFNLLSSTMLIEENNKNDVTSPSNQPGCGSLILSEFAGTAGSLSAALLVNPWDVVGVAQAIDEALSMPREERALKHQQLYDHVFKCTVQVWAVDFVKSLSDIASTTQRSDQPIPTLDGKLCRDHYRVAKKRLIMLDYDGTLTPIVKTPSYAVPSARTLRLLTALCADPCNTVYVISGRDQAFLEKWFNAVPRLGLSGEHGGFLRAPGATQWTNCTEGLDLSWKNDVVNIFTYYTERTQGSFIEHKRASVTWHYRQADSTYGTFQAKECYNHLEDALLSKLPIEILVGKKNLEVRPIAINKGEIVKELLNSAIVLETSNNNTLAALDMAVVDTPESINGSENMVTELSESLSSGLSLRRAKTFTAGSNRARLSRSSVNSSTTVTPTTPSTTTTNNNATNSNASEKTLPRQRTRTTSSHSCLLASRANDTQFLPVLKCSYDFVFCTGDDKTDEDMFKALTSFTDTLTTRNNKHKSHLQRQEQDQPTSDHTTEPPTSEPTQNNFWSVSIGPSTKTTHATWRLTSPTELLDAVESWMIAPVEM